MSFWGRLANALTGRRGKWLVVIFWLALGAAAGPFAGQLTGVLENDSSAWLPRNAESTRALQLQERFPGGQTAPAVVVYVRETGITDADRAKAAADRRQLARLVPDRRIDPVVPSRDGEALLLSVPLEQTDDTNALRDLVERIREDVSADLPPGLEVTVTGPAGQVADLVAAFGGIDTTLLFATVGVVALMLLLTYRSPLLWLLPFLVVGAASQLAQAVVYLLAEYADLTVNGLSAGILVVLVFGAGTDYALLLIARYREELHRHPDRHQAMAVALRRAAPAIVASAGTVVAGLLALLAADLNSTRGLGAVGAVGIVAAFLALTTLLPAMLVIFGRWLFWPFVPRAGTPWRQERSMWARVGAWIAPRRRLVWLFTTAALIALTLGLASFNTGLTQDQVFRTEVESVAGQTRLEAHYPDGAAAPTFVFAAASAAEPVTDAAGGTDGVSSVLPATRAGDLVRIPVILADPPGTEAARHTVERLREAVRAVPGAEPVVGGATATMLDMHNAAARDNRVVIPLVLAVVLVILGLLLRAAVAPVLLVATVVLSFFAALGASAVLFDRVFGFPGADVSLPLLGFVFLVALGIDYNIFLMSRVREEVARIGHAPGTIRGLGATGGVITSAGVVLAATFSVLAVLPLVTFTELGVLVALGVLLDTFVVRSVLVPALTLDVGARIWWPSRLARRGTERPDTAGTGSRNRQRVTSIRRPVTER